MSAVPTPPSPQASPSLPEPAPRAPGEDVAFRPTTPGALATWRVLRALFGPREHRSFSVRLWDGTTEAPTATAPSFTIVLRKPGALRRMLLPPSELSFAEAYISGDADVEGTLEAATALIGLVVQRLGTVRSYLRLLPLLRALPSDEHVRDRPLRRARGLVRHGKRHTPARDAHAVRFHYDVGNEFYSLWLDRRMVYSCAYFEPEVDDLDSAQEAKLEHVCRKLRLAPGERLLDIGCGWGGLILYAAERYGVDALGITLSEPQAEVVRARIAAAGLAGRCRVEVRDYRALGTTPAFDKIASVGMVEHVGGGRLPAYFAAAYRTLKPGGLFLNHGIISLSDARPHSLKDRVAATAWKRGEFIQRYVFPDGHLVPFADVISAAEGAGFETRDVESLREHYVQTLRHWGRRLEAHAAEAERLVGAPTYRVWRLYMAASARAFATADIGVVQTLLAKPDGTGRSTVPPTRRDLYTAPAAPAA